LKTAGWNFCGPRLEKAPKAINMLFTGGNTGKLIVKV
jgi:NADPH-dependent curcumin reductase CurA